MKRSRYLSSSRYTLLEEGNSALYRGRMLRKEYCQIVVGLLALVISSISYGQLRPSAALTGVVTSDAEGFMEGVLVTAIPKHGNIRITVVSDDKGRYSFPASKLKPGKYTLAIRAVGYDLPTPVAVSVELGRPAHANIKLVKTKDLASQLTGQEWIMSVPGTVEQKKALIHCNSCHDVSVIAKSHYDKQGFMSLLPRMQNYFFGNATLTDPVGPPDAPKEGLKPLPIDPDLAEYLSTINLSGGRSTWPYELRTMPRPRGGDTKVIITEYVLTRRTSRPHDLRVDLQGRAWYTDFRRGFIGRVDSVTGENKEWKLPILKPGLAEWSLSFDLDKNGNPWVTRFFQGCAVTMMDAKTGEFHTLSAPPEYAEKNPTCAQGAMGADGTIWLATGRTQKLFMFDPQKGFIKDFNQFQTSSIRSYRGYQDYFGISEKFNRENIRGNGQRAIYGISVLLNDDAVYCETMGSSIGVVDHTTGKVELYQTPTWDAYPRRGTVDPKGRFWFGEWLAGQIGMFDPETKEIQEWRPPMPYTGGTFYRAVADNNGEAWSAGLTSDYVFRLNPKTGVWRAYLLPQLFGNMRDITVDLSEKSKGAWVPLDHLGVIAHVEPLE
jgi:streptogramin lyase